MKPSSHLKIPTSIANLGVRFDSIGMAINKCLYLHAEGAEGSNWEFRYLNEELESLSEDKSNYIYTVAQQVAKKHNVTLSNLKVSMRSGIPLTKGLGSPASISVGALCTVNYFGNIQLSKYELLRLATGIEGHPDNVAPIIYGGLLAGYCNPRTEETNMAHVDIPDVNVIPTIPTHELKTEDSRRIFPNKHSHKKAVQNSATSNTTICALTQHSYDLVGKMMTQDGFYEPHRQYLILEFEKVKTLPQKYDVYAAVISGVGPTILTLSRKEKSGVFVRILKSEVTTCDSGLATTNNVGVIEETVYPS